MTETKTAEEWGRLAVVNELAKRLVACKHFYWMPGMKTSKREIVLRVFENRLEVVDGYVSGCIYPSLTDPGTLGHLLALVREAWGLPGAYFRGGWVYNDNGSSPEDDDEIAGENGMSEAEALVAALEAAP